MNAADLIPTEESEQAALFRWAAWEEKTRPELGLLHAIPNGGYRHPKTAAMLKKTGAKAGVPDMCLPVPRGGAHGLYIELKRRRGGRVSEEQKAWLTALEQQGYRCVVCKGFDEARDAITKYLTQGKEGGN